MAALWKHVASDFSFLSRNVLGGICATSMQKQGVRCLFSAANLGIDGYVKTRERIDLQFKSINEKFRGKMKEFTENSTPTTMIFTEDLKNMVHLVESEPSDMDLIVKMIQKFNQQNKSMRFGNFVFGPVVMRMFHYLNQPQIALNAFLDPELDGFFDQLITYQILLDLLFENNLYDKILQVFDHIKNKQLEGARYPKNVVVLVFAALYKLNTPESLKKATELWTQLQSVGHIPMRRAVTFAAGLAVNQNAPHVALEVLSGVRRPSYVSVRNLKVAALADLGRPEDAFPLLRSVLEADNPQMKFTISKESMDKMREAVNKLGKQDVVMEFEQLEKRLQAGQHIDAEEQDKWLCSEIQAIPRDDLRGDRRFLAASFNRENAPRRFNDMSRQRPGLAQLS